MANVNDFYPSKYLKADDLRGHKVEVVIEKLEVHAVAGVGDRAFLVIDYTDGQKSVRATRGGHKMSSELRQRIVGETVFPEAVDLPEEIDVVATATLFLQQIEKLDFGTPVLVPA